jgi:predicted alpha/beta superfamily hydrolase
VSTNDVKKVVPFKLWKGNWQPKVKTEKPFKHQVTGSTLRITDGTVRWRDLVIEMPRSTATPNVTIINDFYMPQLQRNRRVWVYLPLDYHQTEKSYPVIYMHDGQNLFDVSTSYSGEWQVDESMNLLQAQGDYGAIVVGVDNGGMNRLNEYSPWRNANYGGGEGDAYVDFLVHTLKPYIDKHYRTKPEREATGIIGSSMGALISMYAGFKYPEVFSKLGIFSPSFWFGNNIFKVVRERLKFLPTKIYMIGGERESSTMISNMKTMYATLQSIGFQKDELELIARPDGMHSEWFWCREFPIAYKWLFEDVQCEEFEDMIRHEAAIFREAKNELIWMPPADTNNIKVYNSHWDYVLTLSPAADDEFDVDDLDDGIYYFQLQISQRTVFRKVIVKAEIMAT